MFLRITPSQVDNSAADNSPIISSRSRKAKDDWFEELKGTLVQQYIQYLQTLGLCVVQVTSKLYVLQKFKSRHNFNRPFKKTPIVIGPFLMNALRQQAYFQLSQVYFIMLANHYFLIKPLSRPLPRQKNAGAYQLLLLWTCALHFQCSEDFYSNIKSCDLPSYHQEFFQSFKRKGGNDRLYIRKSHKHHTKTTGMMQDKRS